MARLATSQMMDLGNDVHLETLETHSIEESKEVLCTTLEPSWMEPIIKYLKSEKLPDDPITAQKVKRQDPHYILVKGKLYKMSQSSPLLKFLLSSEVDYALREAHEWIYGNHLGSRALSYKNTSARILLVNHARRCNPVYKKVDSCQCHASIQRRLALELTPLSSPWPFIQWGINTLGPFPIASAQHKFLFMAIDYFTK